MQAGDLLRIKLAQAFGEKIRLFLVIALNIDAIEASNNGFQRGDSIFGVDNFAVTEIRGQLIQALYLSLIHIWLLCSAPR